MALAAAVSSTTLSGNNTPVSVQSEWVTANSNAETAHNAGGEVLNPVALTSSTIAPYFINGKGTTVQVRMRYLTGETVTTAPVVQLFGFDKNNCPERLYDGSDTPLHAITLTAAAGTDVQDGTYSYTDSKEVDANGALYVYVTVKTAAAVAGAGSPIIQVRVK